MRKFDPFEIGWDIGKPDITEVEMMQMKLARSKHWLAVCDAIYVRLEFLQNKSSKALRTLKKSK